jgi:hypothetical protein
MITGEAHGVVLEGLALLEAVAKSAQPGGSWYREGRDVATRMPLLTPAEMAELHPDQHEDWVFTAATSADASYIVAQHPARVLAQLAGRRRIIERHRPVAVVGVLNPTPAAYICRRCTLADWPCDDYLDAAADLLPTEGSPPS